MRVAQLDRALGYGPRCREFESSHARILKSRINIVFIRLFLCSFFVLALADFPQNTQICPLKTLPSNIITCSSLKFMLLFRASLMAYSKMLLYSSICILLSVFCYPIFCIFLTLSLHFTSYNIYNIFYD